MMKRHAPSVFFTVSLCLFHINGLAQPVTVQKPTLVAKVDITIYDAPRNGLFCQKGNSLGTFKAGEKISEYEEIVTYCGIFRKNRYLKYQIKQPNNLAMTVYVGMEDNDKRRFEVQP